MAPSPKQPSSLQTISVVLKVVAIVFGAAPMFLAALFFIAGGPDPGAGSGAPFLFRLVGLPFLLTGVLLALPNRLLIVHATKLYIVPITAGVLLIVSLVLVSANDIQDLPSAIPFVIFVIGALSSTFSLIYYKRSHPNLPPTKPPKDERWVV